MMNNKSKSNGRGHTPPKRAGNNRWRWAGQDKPLEPARAGLNRILRRRAPRYLWASP